MELQHFSHPHPLLLNDDGLLDGYHPCMLCRETVSSGTPCYGCKEDECKYSFYMHKSCAELPHQLQHSLHPKHDPLTLTQTESKEDKYCDGCGDQQGRWAYRYTCSRCNKLHLCIKCASLSLSIKVDIHNHPLTLMRILSQFTCDHCEKEGKGMFYFCATCSFMVHPECTLLPLIVWPPIKEAEIHNHSLTLARKLNSFTCNACGKEGRGMFYYCAICSFVTHLNCASLPLVVKVIRHEHPLRLIYSLPAISPSSHSSCKLCVNVVDTDYGVYYCSSCHFVAHLHCATSKEEKDETFMQKSKDLDEEPIESSTSMLEHEEHGIDDSIDKLPYVVKKFKSGVDGSEIATEIKHFSHEHDLKLIDKFGINEKCDACTRYIFTPYYSCAQCRFFLHKRCAELGRKMRHVIHEHSLMLLPRTTDARGSFRCNACGRHYNGFTYKCEKCQFNLDVQCSELPYNFTHDSHEHGLIFSRSQEGRKCNHCDSNAKNLFCCEDCEFALDFKCLTLPHKVWYEQHEHPFTLCYAPEDDSDEYFCDICENERDPRFWFYYCADCLYPTHLECIIGKSPNIKFGKTFTLDSHQHFLAFVQKTSDDGSHLCKNCRHPIEEYLAYECVECNHADAYYMVYQCSTCDFPAHLQCDTSKEERDETFMQKSKDLDEEPIESSTSMLEHEEHGIDDSIDKLAYVVKKFKLGVDEIEIAVEIKHFSHEHDLKLIEKLGINEKCDACTRYIFTPYYACAQCRFFLHKTCAELRRRMRHPLHRHPLILLPRATYDSGSFGCDACDRHCNGFTYNCEECYFDLDVQCSLLPYNFTHDNHEHRLILSRSQEGSKCNHCDSNAKILFCCTDCEFALDFKCLTLPHRVWYDQHEHPFTLCYAPEDDSSEYYCAICKKERDPRSWFYYCADCIYPAHVECILENAPNIKFGKTFTIDSHQHPLAFVHKTSNDVCKVCNRPIQEDSVYECAECNFIIHEWCLYKIRTSKG